MESRHQVVDTLYYPGIFNTQVQAAKYVGFRKVPTSTGQMMWCEGYNQLEPIHVIYNLHSGPEIADVNTQPFATWRSYFNPINWVGAAFTWANNFVHGMRFQPAENPTPDSVKFHAPVLSNISVGQDTDIDSHRSKYDAWKDRDDRNEGLVLYGVSRGTAATFCAFTQHKYEEVKLVVLEGAIDSIENVVPAMIKGKLGDNRVTHTASNFALRGISLFTAYKRDGISPLECVDDYPEGVPTVFVTSKTDDIVPAENTRRIANALAERGKNDVYLLELEDANHRNYMFSNKQDRDNYEAFIHAVYRRYQLQHEKVYADKGEHLLEKSLLHRVTVENQEPRRLGRGLAASI